MYILGLAYGIMYGMYHHINLVSLELWADADVICTLVPKVMAEMTN
jgi:hypothetical protein